jgi:glycosyltransferase involved in cell wall biosynthesis
VARVSGAGLRDLLARARAVTANSRRCRDDLAPLAAAAARARLVPFGAPALPPGRAPAGLPRRFVLCAARQADHKGQDILLFAWSLLAARGLEVPLVLCGPDHSRGGLARFARRLRLGALVRDLGPLPHARVRALMRRAALVAVPSRVEGFGLAAVEALAAGVPVVAARVGGLPEVVRDGKEGLLVPPSDPAALADAVSRLWKAPALRRRLAAGARRRAPRFSWAGAAARYARLSGLRPGGRVAVVVWQEPGDPTGEAVRANAQAALRALGFRADSACWAGGGRSPLAALAARRPDAWLAFVLRYRTVGVLARFCAARRLTPVVALC